MNSDTLNAPDALRSRPGTATGETNDLNSNPNQILSQRRDEQISEDARPKEGLERRNDATCDVKLSSNGSLDAMEEIDDTKETAPRSPLPNAGKSRHDVLTCLTDAISQSLTKPASPSTSQGSISTIHPIEHTQNKKYASHIPREIILTTSTSINISHNRSKFLQSTSHHGQTDPAGPSSKSSISQINATALALNTLKTTAHIQEEILLNQMNAESSAFPGSLNSSSARTGKSTGASAPVRPKPNTPSTPSLAGTMHKVVPNIVLGPRHLGFVASDTSRPSTISRDPTKNKALQKTLPLVTQNLDHPISAQIPPLSPQHLIHSSPKPPSNLILHSPISSPSCSNTNQETPLFAPSSPTLPINPSLKDLSNHKSEDGYTSADAEGESIAGSDSGFEFIESSVIDTQPIHSIRTTSAIVQSSNQSSHKLIYDPFTPPLTRESSLVPSQLTEHKSTPRRATRLRLFLSYVDVPPLPEGVTKLEYRPFKRAKRAHNDAEYFPGSTSRNSWKRDWYGGIKGRARDAKRQSRPRTVRSSSVLSMATTASSTVPYERQAGQPKTILPKAPVRSTMKTSGKASAVEGRSSTMASPSTIYHSSSQPLPSAPSIQVPPPLQLVIKKHRIHDAEHLSPVVTYFNTRHYHLCLEEDSISWTLLGAQILMQCPGQRKLGCVREMELDDDDEIDGVDYRVGGPMCWEGCSNDEEEEESLMSQLQKRRGKSVTRSGLDVRKPKSSVAMQKKPSQTPSVTRSLGTSVPKIDLTKVLKEKTSTTTRPRKLNWDIKDGHANSPAETSDITVPAVSQAQSQSQHQHQPRSPAAVEQQPKWRPYLSEKARGKQKAVDSDFVEPDFHGDLRPITAPSSTTNQSLLDVDTLSPTINSPIWPRSVDQYITFDASPTKLGGSNSGDDGYAPNFAYDPYDTNQFLSSRTNMDDLFLPPHDVEPSIFNDGTDLMEGIDAYHDRYGMSMSAEKEVQPTTVNPTLLGGNAFDHATDEAGLTFGVTTLMDDADSTEIEDERLRDVTMHEEQLLGMKTGFESILGSPIISAARSSSSSSNVSPRSSQSPSTPVHSRSVSVALLGRTSSPEFSDFNVPSRLRLSSLPRTPRSIKRVQTERSLSRQDIFVSSEDEEEEVRRGLEYADAFSTSDEDFIPPSDLEKESEDVDRVRPTSLKSKRKFSVSSSPNPTPAPTAVAKTFRRTQDWECGSIRSCCHVCRTSSNRLKMVCPCGLKYCNRCMALRFPDIEFRSAWDSSECPSCKDWCTCDKCAKKRGEVYVSRRRNREYSLQIAPIMRPRRTVQPTVQTCSWPQLIALPSPEAVENTENFSFWGSIYDMNGSKIAVGFAGKDDEVVVANAVEGYTRPKIAESVSEDDLPASRTFVGAYQPFWGLGTSPIIKDLGGRGRTRRSNAEDDGTDLRWYIGKENLLYRSVAARTRDLPTNLFSDISSLSSLSDDSDVEVDGNTCLSVVDKTTTINFIEDIKDDKKNIKRVDFNAIQARDTVHILQTIARDICGMMGNVEQSLMST